MRRPSEHVDPFLGTEIADLPAPRGIAATWTTPKPPIGNTHPGPTSPFGMVSVCPFSGGYPTGYGRYAPSLSRAPNRMATDDAVTGFTHFQQSGTGRIGAYYNLLRVAPGGGRDRFTPTDEQASPGRYSCALTEVDVQCELTVAPRAAFHRYTFGPRAGDRRVTFDLSSIGLAHDGAGGEVSLAELTIAGPTWARGRVAAGGPPVHFHIEWSGADFDHLWLESGAPVFAPTLRLAPGDAALAESFGMQLAVHGDGPVEVRIGFSLRSTDQAADNLGADAVRSFEQLAERAAARWDESLGRIELVDATDEQRTIFYTALYHSLIKPADFTGENPFADDDGPVFFDLSTLWDIYRTQLPLVFALFPDRASAIANALCGVAEREGDFPISYLLDNRPERFGRQASALAHVVIADARVRGIDGVDWDRALGLMARTLDLGRGAAYRRDGVVHPLSHTLDLAYAHHCTAWLAAEIGDPEIEEHCASHVDGWRNAFDLDTGLLGDSEYYEGEKWNYSFRLLHDLDTRIADCGGDERFTALLDHFFGFDDTGAPPDLFRFEGLNNEPDMEAPFAYLWVGRHDRAVEVVRAVMAQRFATGAGGLPGNDDSGGLSSWLAWNMLGLFPVAGQDLMLVGSPVIREARVRLLSGDLTITAAGDGPYVRGAALEGRELDAPWLRWTDLAAGGRLQLAMADEPTGWGRYHRPPCRAPSALVART